MHRILVLASCSLAATLALAGTLAASSTLVRIQAEIPEMEPRESIVIDEIPESALVNYCSLSYEKFQRRIESAQACEADSDCVEHRFSCPWEFAELVHRDAIPEIEEYIEQSTLPGCRECISERGCFRSEYRLRCLDNRCTRQRIFADQAVSEPSWVHASPRQITDRLRALSRSGD